MQNIETSIDMLDFGMHYTDKRNVLVLDRVQRVNQRFTVPNSPLTKSALDTSGLV